MKKDELYGHFKGLIQSQPDFSRYYDALNDTKRECDMWLARAMALVEAHANPFITAPARTAVTNLSKNGRDSDIRVLNQLLLQCLASLELAVSPAAQGSFVAAGNAMDAFSALTQLFGQARSSLLVVDPYMDETLLVEFLTTVKEGVSLDLLSDEDTCRPSL